jgi:hypothetical protein
MEIRIQGEREGGRDGGRVGEREGERERGRAGREKRSREKQRQEHVDCSLHLKQEVGKLQVSFLRSQCQRMVPLYVCVCLYV